MEEYEEYSDGAAGPADDEFDTLLMARSELSHALRNERDPNRRQELLNRLSENRAEILRMQRDLGIDSPQSAALRTSRSYLVDPWSPEGAEQQQPSAQRYDYGDPQARLAGVTYTQPNPGFQGGGMPQAGNQNQNNMNRTLVAVGLTVVAALLVGLLAFQFLDRDDGTETASDGVTAAGDGTEEAAGGALDQISAVLQGMGLNGVVATEQDGIIYLIGMVASETDKAAALGAAQALAGDQVVDGTQLAVSGSTTAGPTTEPAEGSREASLQGEIDRILAATPIIFELGDTELTDLHIRILDNMVSLLQAYPDLTVNVVGFTDDQGTEDANRAVSLARAENVKAYLVAQGIADASLDVEARGEDTSSQSSALRNLERRVEFEVVPAAGVLAPNGETFRVAIVAPSARNDLAFTQSMVDAVNVVAAERGNVEVAITDNTFVVEEASAAIRDYATQGYDLIVAHGSQFGSELITIAPEFPDVAFAWGTASDTFGLPNVYAYDAASEEGGYVMGAMSGLLSENGIIGVVGPIEVGDAERYVNGFKAGAEAEAAAEVLVTYTQSFSDLTLAADAARAHVDAGADVMTGSAQMVVGAVSVASENDVFWFGTQANQSTLDPNIVVASQVYHWEVILREIVSDIDAGTASGRAYSANLANGGLVIEYNRSVTVSPEVRARADELINDIATNAITVPS